VHSSTTKAAVMMVKAAVGLVKHCRTAAVASLKWLMAGLVTCKRSNQQRKQLGWATAMVVGAAVGLLSSAGW
jgi:hypothetical protein